MKRESVDWDIVFALMLCYGMIDPRGFPIPKKKKKRAVATCHCPNRTTDMISDDVRELEQKNHHMTCALEKIGNIAMVAMSKNQDAPSESSMFIALVDIHEVAAPVSEGQETT